MKRFLIGVATGALMLSALAAPVSAERPGYGEQPGYAQADPCGQSHGAFAYFDGDTNLGVLGPGTPEYHGGAVGQEPGATGYNNSHTNCQ
jgi:hypothetical protein